MPQITWVELVLALTIIGIKRAWQAWRSVPTYYANNEPLPLAAQRVTTPDPLTIDRA